MKWFLCFCKNQMMGLINYWSEVTHRWILLRYMMILMRTKEKSRTLEPLHGEGWRDLYTDNLFPEIMRLIYWVKVNSSMTTFTDHHWIIPFHDKYFPMQSFILHNCISYMSMISCTVGMEKVCQSLEDILACHSLKSYFNHDWIFLSHTSIMIVCP